MKHRQHGFTLLEVLLVVAALGVLAAIVIVAVNPQRQMGKVRDAERQGEVSTLREGIEQYYLDSQGQYPSGIEVNSYHEICDTEAVSPSNCPDYYVDLSGLVPEQLADIPRDPQASDTNEDTGYEVGKDEDGNIVVKAPDTEVDNSVKRAGTTLPVGYHLSSASYDNQSFDVSGQDGGAVGVTFSGNGNKMFMVGAANDNVYSYNLSTAYDISTASYNQTIDVSGEDSAPRGVTFNGNGTKMFMVGRYNENLYSYDLSTAYDISSASYTQSFNMSGQDGGPVGVAFNGDGSKMFMVGEGNDNVYSYNLSTAYDISTASYNQTIDVSGEDSAPRGVTFNEDGTKMFVVGRSNDNVYSYNLSTAYDLGSASYNQSFDVSGQDGESTGLAFSEYGSKMVISGPSTNKIYQYSTTEEK
ncbi:MAG: hypothetical protein BRC23_00215 [Parcubacteria group bacterium SW_4_49_11]|nr:MAG: hypothetical protein BRC23_00215 [Parcubacteria group bacterium SW_4_49_11]